MTTTRAWWWMAALMALPLAAYSSAPQNGFVWDDHHVIERGRLITSLANIPRLFAHNAMFNSDGGAFAATAVIDTYRPLTITTFALERAAFGLWPAPYHVTSVLLHVVVVLLLFAVGRRTGASVAGAAVGALIFGVHPAISEAVHWINGRSDPLALAFFLGATLVWLRFCDGVAAGNATLGRGAAVALLALAATLAKETVFLLALPLALVLLQRRLGWRGTFVAVAPWAGGLGLGFALRMAALERLAVAGGGYQLRYALVRVPVILRDGLASLVLPAARLRPSLYEHYRTVDVTAVIVSIALLLAIAVGAAWLWRRCGAWMPAWAVATFVAALSPIALLTYGEGWSGWGRYLYPAAALLSLVAGAAVVDVVLPMLRRPARLATAGVGALAIALCAAQTLAEGAVWRDDRSFAMAQIIDAPESSVGYRDLAYAEIQAGRDERALPLLDRAVALAPDNAEHHARRGVVLQRLGRPADAWKEAQKALSIDPRHRMARHVAAIGLLQQRRDAEAASMLVAVIAEEPWAEGFWSTLRQARARLGADSPFAQTVRALARDPRYAGVAPALIDAVR